MNDETPPDLWSGDRVERWLRRAEGLERQLAPVSELLLEAVRLAPGEMVLDVGCGTGPTTHAAAAAVGPSGRVCGLDVSGEMLAAAASAAEAGPDVAPIEWIEADAVTWVPDAARFDAVISRFGVMFFSDPARAFGNLAVATHARGRLAFAAWQRRDASDLFSVPLHAAIAVLGARGIRSTADGVDLADFVAIDGDGPFSLHDPAAVTSLLEGAGWTDVEVRQQVLSLPFAGGSTPGVAAEAALDFGPTRLVLSGLDAPVVREAQESIAEAFGAHVDAGGHVVLSGAINLVTASRG